MPWQHAKRPDGKIAITLDNNVWDFLFQRGDRFSGRLTGVRAFFPFVAVHETQSHGPVERPVGCMDGHLLVVAPLCAKVTA